MKPQEYLTKKGKEYFKQIEKILKERGMDDDAYSIELSMLSSEFASYEEAMELGAEHGFYNEYENKTRQVNAFHTMKKDALVAIQKLSPKFGLNPADFEKIKKGVREDETDPVDSL